MAADNLAQFQFGRLGALGQKRVERHQDARRAEAALQRVMAPEGVLQGRKPLGRRRQPLNGADVESVHLHRERQAGARRDAVDLHRAGAADAVLAADMRPGRTDEVAQRVGEQRCAARPRRSRRAHSR